MKKNAQEKIDKRETRAHGAEHLKFNIRKSTDDNRILTTALSRLHQSMIRI